MNYKLKQTGQEVQDILDNASLQHPIHTIESFVPTTKLANGVYCTEDNTIVVVQDNGNKVALLNPVNGAMYYQWQDDEYVINCLGVIATDEILLDEIHKNGIFYSKSGKSLWIFENGGADTASVGVRINSNSGISFCVWNDQEGYYDFFGSLGEIIVNTHASKVTLSMQVSAVDKFDFDIFAATQNDAGVMSAADKTKLDGIENGAQVNSIERIRIGTSTPLNISNDGTIILPINGDMYGNPKGNSLTTYDAHQALQGLVNSISSNLNGLQDHIQSELSTIYNTIATKANIDYPTFTGIPTAPTAASGTNTTQIATTAFVQAAIAAAITGRFKFVATLPATGDIGYIYLVPHNHEEGTTNVKPDLKDEFIWDADASKWELIGNTDIDLSSYWSKDELRVATSNEVLEVWNNI